MRKLAISLAALLAACGGGSPANSPGSAGAAGTGNPGGGSGGIQDVPPETAKPTTTLPFNEWVDITPKAMQKDLWTTPGHGCAQPGDISATSVCTYGAGSVNLDLRGPSGGVDAYVSTNMLGLWRQSSTGEWTRLGDPAGPRTPEMTAFLPQIFDVKIDPRDSSHLYLTSGVQGPQHGFYVSRDRGATWKMPDGFVAFSKQVGSDDTTVIDVDPGDFNHILISFHSDWTTTTEYSSGIGESRDGGETWVAHSPPNNPWGAGTKSVLFLHHLKSGKGNGDTWLVGDEAAGFWRTADAGKTWKQVSTRNAVHGGPTSYFTEAGVLYIGAFGTPLRSSDVGETMEEIPQLGTKYYFTIIGDGDRLYTRAWNDTGPYMVSPETDGLNWTALEAGKNPSGDTFYLEFDTVNRVLYSGNHVVGDAVGSGGVYALRLPPK